MTSRTTTSSRTPKPTTTRTGSSSASGQYPKLAFVQEQEPDRSEVECRKILTELVGR